MSSPISIICAAGGRCSMPSHCITKVKHVWLKCDKPVRALCGVVDDDASCFRRSTTCTLCLEDIAPSVSTLSEISVPIEPPVEPGDERNKRKYRPPAKKRNEWLHEQFRRDYQDGTYRFFCNQEGASRTLFVNDSIWMDKTRRALLKLDVCARTRFGHSVILQACRAIAFPAHRRFHCRRKDREAHEA
jgi:hypothetical protein